jgi:hypothetical protein
LRLTCDYSRDIFIVAHKERFWYKKFNYIRM